MNAKKIHRSADCVRQFLVRHRESRLSDVFRQLNEFHRLDRKLFRTYRHYDRMGMFSQKFSYEQINDKIPNLL